MKNNPVRLFIILTYVVFWVLFSVTGILVFSDAPQIYQTVMKNICAWASTIVLIVLFKKLRPGESLTGFLKQQFTRVGIADFLLPLLIQTGIAAVAAIMVYSVKGEPVQNIRFFQLSGILPLLLINITSGPTGEELGWRGYLLAEFRKKFNLLSASLLIGILWGLWHFPLWLVSGYSGTELLYYSGSFMLGIISFSVFLTYFYSRSGNILTAVWMHFLFNILMQVVVIEDISFMFFVSLLYFVVSAVIVAVNRRQFLFHPVPTA